MGTSVATLPARKGDAGDGVLTTAPTGEQAGQKSGGLSKGLFVGALTFLLATVGILGVIVLLSLSAWYRRSIQS